MPNFSDECGPDDIHLTENMHWRWLRTLAVSFAGPVAVGQAEKDGSGGARLVVPRTWRPFDSQPAEYTVFGGSLPAEG